MIAHQVALNRRTRTGVVSRLSREKDLVNTILELGAIFGKGGKGVSHVGQKKSTAGAQ